MKKQPLKVGFDLDGVLLYNPARVVRPIIVLFKKIFLPKEVNTFHYPKTKFQEFIWFLLHKSSIFVAPGLEDIKGLVKTNKIEAYIISARYESLRNDFNNWLNKIDAKKNFTACYYNNNDEQPQIYKLRKIKELKLDIFIEDNWDIVKYLNSQLKKTKIIWIYNLLDRNIKYPYKFSTLKKILQHIENT